MDVLARFVGFWMVFAICIAVDVEGAAFGAACTGNGTGDCAEKINVVCKTTCVCAADSFRNASTNCTKKVALTMACTAQPADQCADANAECQGNKCVCQAGHFVNKTGACHPVSAALKDACDATDPSKDQCTAANTECRKDGTDKCLCKTTHYEKSATCKLRKSPNATCSANECVTHASCVSTICVCDAGYTQSPATKPTMCNSAKTMAIVEISTIIMCFMMAYFEVLK